MRSLSTPASHPGAGSSAPIAPWRRCQRGKPDARDKGLRLPDRPHIAARRPAPGSRLPPEKNAAHHGSFIWVRILAPVAEQARWGAVELVGKFGEVGHQPPRLASRSRLRQPVADDKNVNIINQLPATVRPPGPAVWNPSDAWLNWPSFCWRWRWRIDVGAAARDHLVVSSRLAGMGDGGGYRH